MQIYRYNIYMSFEKDEGRRTELDTETREKERGRKKGRKDWKGRNEGWERMKGRGNEERKKERKEG